MMIVSTQIIHSVAAFKPLYSSMVNTNPFIYYFIGKAATDLIAFLGQRLSNYSRLLCWLYSTVLQSWIPIRLTTSAHTDTQTHTHVYPWPGHMPVGVCGWPNDEWLGTHTHTDSRTPSKMTWMP